MFDVNATDGSVRKREYRSPIPGGEAPGAQSTPPNKLDAPFAVQLHSRLLNYYTREIDKQWENRAEMALDEDFYDHHQWSPEDAAEVEARGQKPIVYNVISASIDWITGTEKRARSDFKVLPRRKPEAKPAQRKTELMKYLSDVNRTPFDVSDAFTDAVKVGVGWIEDGITDEGEDEPLYTRYESWRNILWDSNSVERDLRDARYMFRARWFDLDIAEALFPKRVSMLRRAAQAGDELIYLDAYGEDAMDSQEMLLEQNARSGTDRVTGYTRERVRIIEGWIALPIKTKRIKGGPFAGELYDEASRGHRESIAAGEGELVEKMTMRMHVAIFTSVGMLWLSESPYRHNRFPFTPVWGKRRGRDKLPYGVIRGLRDIQEDINKRASKALYILSENKIIMDEDALPEDQDLEEFRAEAARPDAILLKRAGKDIKFEVNRDLSQYQLELMSRSISMIQQASGVTDELLGRETGAKSGIAIQRRQDQGSLASALFFDNLRFAQQLRGEKQLSNIEQFMDERKAFRITNQRGNAEFVEVNDGLPESDIVRSKADFIISDADWQATLRQAAVDQLVELISRLPPQVSLVLIDLVVENMDIANADEIVKRLRAVNGQKDPDGDEEPTPEEIERDQAQQAQAQLQQRALLADLAKKEAEAGKLNAQVEQIRAQIAGNRVDTQGRALEVAGNALSLPSPAVHTADHILAEAGAAPQPAAPPMPTQPTGLGPAAAPMPSQPAIAA